MAASMISIKILSTKNPIPVSPIMFFTIILFSLTINVKSENLSLFNFTTFVLDNNSPPGHPVTGPLALANDATVSNGAIHLTKKDQSGNPLPHSVGQAGLFNPIRIYDKTTGKVADFTTKFTFVVAKHGQPDHGDGLAFFFIPPGFKFPNKTESSGGFLGLFTKDNAFKSKDQILLVEFDTYDNAWDPYPNTEAPHIGINVGSIKSLTSAYWFLDFKPDGAIGTATISYDSKTCVLSVTVSYNDNGNVKEDSSVAYGVDLTKVLPEEVLIGFSAATGDSVETHEILSWSITSNM